MICIVKAKKFCREDITSIKGYEEAMADTTHMWICHHINAEPFTGFTTTDLKKMNMYFNRPASELRFVTRNEHAKIHKVSKYLPHGNMKGKHHTEDAKDRMRAAFKGKHWHIENGKRIWTD